MAEVMVAVMPFAGHVGPALRATEALLRAGHRVRVYVGSAYTAAVERAGAAHVPWRAAPDFDERDLRATFPQVGRGGPRGVLVNMEHVFVRTAVGQVADLSAEYARAPWDVLLADTLSLGGALTAELLDTPWASLSVVPLTIPSRDLPPPGVPVEPGHGPAVRVRDAALRGLSTVLTAPLARALRQTRASVGLPPGGPSIAAAWFSPSLVLAHGVAGLEAPRSDLPPQVHFIGAFPTPPSAAPLPDWWDEVTASTRPLVHVTQGTFNTDPSELIRPSLAALEDRDVTVVVTTGSRTGEPLPFPVPPNARVAGLLPYADLLPRTDVMVTNGGWGGVLAGLAHGIPLVVAGADLDKPTIAAMVARSGAGVDLRTGRPAPEAVGAAVDRLLADPEPRRRAAGIAAELAAHDAGAELVGLVERLLATRAPVVRDADPWGNRRAS